MSYKLNSSNCSLIDDSSENNIVAKLRRLKIEENLLVNNINKANTKETEVDNSELPVIYDLDLRHYTAKLKNSLTEIKNMFGDLKAMTMTEEKLSSVDIDNMKRDVVKLDDKIRVIKNYLHSELALEMSKERELTKQIHEVEERQAKLTFKPKSKIKPFNDIVPSPVKVMINSPFKCKEVQNFQEFMMSSPNRYGGWNEYHHNVFVQIWQKYFKRYENIILNESEETILNQDQFQAFQMEVLDKITGCTNDDIVWHHKWYYKYLYLKEQQRIALNKWKRNKGIMSKSECKQGVCEHQHKNLNNTPKPYNCNGAKLFTNMENMEELLDTIETRDADEIANDLCDMTLQVQESLSFDAEIDKSEENKALHVAKLKQRSFSDVLKPTKQWISRCASEREGGKEYNDLESIKKLRIPDWRLALQD